MTEILPILIEVEWDLLCIQEKTQLRKGECTYFTATVIFFLEKVLVRLT